MFLRANYEAVLGLVGAVVSSIISEYLGDFLFGSRTRSVRASVPL